MLRLAYYLELTWLFTDAASGFLQNHSILLPGNQTLGSVIRMAAILLLLAIVATRGGSKRRPALILLSLCVVWSVAHMIVSGLDLPRAIADIQFLMKLMMPVLLFCVMQIQMSRGALDERQLKRMVALNAVVLLVNLSLGLFGIGFGNYGESEDGELLGSKGFFYAGNEVSATLVAIFALVVFVWRERFRAKPFLLLAAVGVFFVASLVSLSKTSLLGFVLILLFTVQNYLSRANKIKFSAVLAIVTLVTVPYWIPLLQTSIERWQYFWDLAPDFVTFITSGRTDRIEDYTAWWRNLDSVSSAIFGEGQLATQLYENDALDLTYTEGALGIVFYLIWVSWGLRALFVLWARRRSEGGFTGYMIAMFLMLSVFAGHVIYSAALAPFIALLALSAGRSFPDNALRPATEFA